MAEQLDDLYGSEMDKTSRSINCSAVSDLRTWTSILHIFLAGDAIATRLIARQDSLFQL